MMSTRYAWGIVAMFAIALVPAWIHTYGSTGVDDGRRLETLPAVLAGLPSTSGARDREWAQRRFGAGDFLHRQYGSGSRSIALLAARSTDFKRLYHHPENTLLYPTAFDREETIRPAGLELPVHVVPQQDGRGFAAYVLEYDDVFVDNPYVFHLSLTGRLLVRPRRQMTLLLVHDPQAPPQTAESSEAVALLVEAVRAFAGEGGD